MMKQQYLTNTTNVSVLKIDENLFVARRIEDDLIAVIIYDQPNRTFKINVPYCDDIGHENMLSILINSLDNAIIEVERIKLL